MTQKAVILCIFMAALVSGLTLRGLTFPEGPARLDAMKLAAGAALGIAGSSAMILLMDAAGQVIWR